MADLDCPAFIPMYIHGDYLHCAHCGLTMDYHKAYVDHGTMMMTNHVDHHHHHIMHHHYQQPQYLIDPHPPPTVLPADPHNNNLHHLPMEEMMLLQPPQPVEPNNYEAQLEKENVNMALVPAIRSWVFSEYQIVGMFTMAGRYQWSLRGHSRNEELHHFCDEIGISWTQFSNWVHRNRARFGPPNI